jgi:rhodanese-related sulfurtransferase
MSLRSRLRAGLDAAADRVVAAALGQRWAPLAPRPPRDQPVRPPPTLPARAEAPPVDLDVVPDGALLLDVREPAELARGIPEGAMVLPMDLVPHHLDRLPRDRDVVVVCAAGVRSHGVATWLRRHGVRAWSLSGGVHAAGVPLRSPPEPRPGTRVIVPAGSVVDGALVPEATVGEVILADTHTVRVRAHDAGMFHVEHLLPREAVQPWTP